MVSMSQTFKMYEMVNKYLKNNEDAKAIVLGIEGIIDERFESQKDQLATKHDLTKEISRIETRIEKVETKMEQGFKDQLKWIIMLMLGFSSLIIALIKLT